MRCRAVDAGEKSFTTLALLLALGGVTQVPFAMFDEIVRTHTPLTARLSRPRCIVG